MRVNRAVSLTAAICISAAMVFGACSPRKAQTKSGGSAKAVSVAVQERQAGMKVVYPDKISGQLNNPGMGWVILEEPTFAGHMDLGYSGDFPEADNISLSTAWADIEKTENVYDWSLLDQTISYWTAKGKKINLRICTDSLVLPYTYEGIPSYLFTKYGLKYREDTDDTRPYKLADLSNAKYQERLKLFLTKLAEKYGNNKDVDVVEIRGYGKWGEWHSGYSYGSYDERINVLQKVVGDWEKAWKGKKKVLVVSASAEYRDDITPYVANPGSYSDFLNWSAFDYAMKFSDVTFRRDGAAGCLK